MNDLLIIDMLPTYGLLFYLLISVFVFVGCRGLRRRTSDRGLLRFAVGAFLVVSALGAVFAALVLDMALGGKITGADVCRRIRRRSGGTGSVFTYVHRVADKLGVASRKEVLDACARYDLLCPGFPTGLACGMPGIR